MLLVQLDGRRLCPPNPKTPSGNRDPDTPRSSGSSLYGEQRKTAGAKSPGSIPSGGWSGERRPLLGLDPFGLLRWPKPFAPEVVIARPQIWAARFVSSLQRQGGLFAIPLRSRQHGN
jgi:hypothetical protein